jgi:uncharacterized protein CbrC (UPF0167 family)
LSPRRILDTFKDADGLPVTATFAAFMLENGYSTYREAQDSDGFTLWQSERWLEFCNAVTAGAPTFLAPTKEDRARFIHWLDARAHDHAARREVEAA